jgi:DNA adenine methylase
VIADVPKTKLLSPFRYPGGKTWLVPRVFEWLSSSERSAAEFIEPFAGGGIVGLNVAYYGLARKVTLVELDENVSAVWQTILNGEATHLAGRIVEFHPTRRSVRGILSGRPEDVAARAFQTIVRNRINHGGIMAAGAGMLKKGENGNGIGSRWYPETLRDRILEIARMRERIIFVHGDGLQVLRDNADRKSAFFFIDPPYTAGRRKVGARLYNHHELDHEQLFQAAADLTGDFLTTYADRKPIHDLARRHGFQVKRVLRKLGNHGRRAELLISRKLSWL